MTLAKVYGGFVITLDAEKLVNRNAVYAWNVNRLAMGLHDTAKHDIFLTLEGRDIGSYLITSDWECILRELMQFEYFKTDIIRIEIYEKDL